MAFDNHELAGQFLDQLPVNGAYETFNMAQHINLKRLRNQVIDDSELSYLASVAQSIDPSSGNAMAVYYLVSGINLHYLPTIEVDEYVKERRQNGELGKQHFDAIVINDQLKIFNHSEESILVDVYNLQGMHMGTVTVSSYKEDQSINTSRWQGGVYFLIAREGRQTSYRKVILIR